ncbi:MAG: aspartate dehydrogenase [Lachnospiraceae bacterium]|nr:aspartate dehydrogenase [Lachnospiraceae bacterium]MBQ8167410.1 aspartate dehydrogenase [Lachnospiraceae bacterium]
MSIKNLFAKRKQPLISYNPETQYPIIRSSICTGEQVAGFKCKETGRFTEVMLIRNDKDLSSFRDMYNLGEIKKEY